MTWSVKVTDTKGESHGAYSACSSCAHGQGYTTACYIARAYFAIGNFLTAIDVDANGRMATGTAQLMCCGFEPVTQKED